MKTTIRIALLAMTLFLAAACQPASDTATGTDLAGTGWLMSTLGGDPPVAGTVVSLQFGTDGTAAGSDGCNQFRTTYTQDGDNLTFDQASGMSTLIACDEAVTAQATAFQEALAAVETFSATEQALALMDGDGNELAAFAVVSQELGGTSWIVTNYNNGREAVVGVIEGSELTAVFSEDGAVNGTAGCNNYFATYKADAETGTITISEVGSTMMACEGPEGVMAQEQEFLAALATVATYRVQGNTLEMRTADDALAVMMRLNQ